MPRILTGIQSTGVPHLGNILGAIQPAIDMATENENCFFFIADLHSLTTIRDKALIQDYTKAAAAAWIALGLDYKKHTFYKQSSVPEVTELTWYLNCFAPYSLLKKSHAFKDKSEQVAEINCGLFTYPVLMAADILLYDADIVPVGKDQKQHIEITRDICQKFNNAYGDILVEPVESISEEVKLIPGTDGQKMSKSRNNSINIFAEKKALKKQVMSIVTDTTPLEEPKDPDNCHVFTFYKLLANESQVAEMRQNYLGGNYGYGHAKKALLELILEKYEQPRERFNQLMASPDELNEILEYGAQKARATAQQTLSRVREVVGYDSK